MQTNDFVLQPPMRGSRVRRPVAGATLLAALAALASCSTPATPTGAPPQKPVTLVAKVDLPRYMGDWYVIASIPTSIEEHAFNAKESYKLEGEDKIASVFTFNEGGFTGEQKTYNATAYVLDKASKAVWGEQFVWPVKADYRITYVSPDYREAVVAREKRDYVWILARTPSIPDATYQRLAAVVTREGYDASKLQRVPQAGAR